MTLLTKQNEEKLYIYIYMCVCVCVWLGGYLVVRGGCVINFEKYFLLYKFHECRSTLEGK